MAEKLALMLSLAYLISALWLGATVTRRLGLRLSWLEAPALSVTLGLILWAWLSFVSALLLPYTYSLPLTLGLAGGLSLTLWRRSPAWKIRPWEQGPLATAAWGVFTGATTLLLGYLMWTHDLLPLAGSLYSANSTWADFGLHMSLISHFAYAERFSFDFPVAAGSHLTYPFMIDLLTAWLVRGGWSIQLSLFVPALLLVVAFLQLMLGFGIRLFHRVGGAIAGLTVMLLSGSAVGAFTALSDYRSSGLTLGQFLNHLPQDYTTLTTPNAQVSNVVADILLPQRAFLMGFAAFATLLILFDHLRHYPTRKLALFAGSLIGLLPLVHAHTFVVILAILAGLYLESALKTKRLLNIWVWVGTSALTLALPQVLWQSLANSNGTGGFFSPGWTIQAGESLLSFWAHNFGLTGLLIIGLLAAFVMVRSWRKYLVWYAPLAAIFLAANLYSLQPFAYDNLKLMLYVYLLTYIFAGYGALWLIRRYKLAIVPVSACALLLVGSGTLAVMREFQHQDLFASADDIALAAWVRTATAPTDVFLTTDRPNQPVSTLAGRSVVSGYRGWLYAYHMDYSPRLATIQQALSGELQGSNPYKYSAKYLAVATAEPAEWSVDRPALEANYQRVYSNGSWTVYLLP